VGAPTGLAKIGVLGGEGERGVRVPKTWFGREVCVT